MRGDQGVDLEVISDTDIVDIEPKLVKLVDAGLGRIDPDGVAFTFAEFLAGRFVEYQRRRPDVRLTAIDLADHLDTRHAVAPLV